ncbi:MAG: DmsC/YnfH family molybdoenzyme membrane anchor subunit [Pseudomonadales bacterium]
MTVSVYDPILASKASETIFPLREDEPAYALLNDPQSQETNCYGKPIDLIGSDLGVSLNINGVDEIGPNPNRTKQHGFHFTADNCIGCHACEAACSEKNDLPAHISFRSVGYVEGGTYPNFQRMNISMACNHCDDPVCLKGCPTRAYTKHAEYGAVIQDPDICFGCGYCTWVCPYNAPQLDPVAGQVEKCNMCVDRLEVGLKPACVSACVGNALEFGVIENIPENRNQASTQIAGFPDPSITQPNIRFEQTKTLPREMTRTDSAPVKYRLDNDSQKYTASVDEKDGRERHWNMARLSSKENPLVVFTLAVQAAIGAFAGLFLGSLVSSTMLGFSQSSAYLPALFIACCCTALGLLLSATHVGKPLRFYRGFNNLRHSPVSREGLGVLLFLVFLGLHMLSSAPANPWLQNQIDMSTLTVYGAICATLFGWLAIAAGFIGLYYMYRCYRIKARPFWDHWQTGSSFAANGLTLGGLVCGLVGAVATADTAILVASTMLMAAGMLLEAIGLLGHHKNMSHSEHEGAASHYIQCTTFGHTYLLRNSLLGLNLLSAAMFAALAPEGIIAITLWSMLAVSSVAVAFIGRALFYVLVIPTTMPGAFFWKNKAFEQHARDIGLANWPQVGVAPEGH